MTNYHPENERTKRAYFAFLKEAKGLSEPSIDAAASAIARFETYTHWKSFKAFHFQQAIGFKRRLASQAGQRSGEPLSKSTLRQTLAALKAFFEWLAVQPGFKSHITYADAAYFRLSRKDEAVAKAGREKRVPTLEQIHHVLASMPNETDIERRNRAVIAFALLTCARVDAIASIRLKHIDLDAGRVFQDARQVRTKFSKTFPTFFFPVGGEALAIVTDWVTYLRRDLLWGLDDPLFPATQIALGADRKFEAVGLDRKGWSNSTPVRTIFRDAFIAAGLQYFNPHSFRDTLTRLGEQICRTPEDLIAWSQNMAHEDVLTTIRAYGSVPTERQAELIRKAGSRTSKDHDVLALIAAVERLTQQASR